MTIACGITKRAADKMEETGIILGYIRGMNPIGITVMPPDITDPVKTLNFHMAGNPADETSVDSILRAR